MLFFAQGLLLARYGQLLRERHATLLILGSLGHTGSFFRAAPTLPASGQRVRSIQPVPLQEMRQVRQRGHEGDVALATARV